MPRLELGVSNFDVSARLIPRYLSPLNNEEKAYWGSILLAHCEPIKTILVEEKRLLEISSPEPSLTDFFVFLVTLDDQEISTPILEGRIGGLTPLALACMLTNQDDEDLHVVGLYISKELIVRGANVNCRLYFPKHLHWKITPIAVAVSKNDAILAQLLLENGANPSVEVNEMKVTPLFLAVRNESALIFNKLLRFGADINHLDVDGNTVLIVACAVASVAIVKTILSQAHKYKVNVNHKNKRQCSALHAAVYGGDSVIVKVILLHGVELNAKTVEGFTPMDIAHILGETHIEELLGKVGGILTLREEEISSLNPAEFCLTHIGNCTPLHSASRENDTSYIKYFLSQGADVNARTISQTTPLHAAVTARSTEAALLLLQNGAAVNAKQFRGFTPLFIATVLVIPNMVELFLKYGASTDILYDAGSPKFISILHAAVMSTENKDFSSEEVGAHEIVKLLIRGYAPFDIKDISGRTALSLAIERGKQRIVEALNLQYKLYSWIQHADLKKLNSCVKKGAIVNCRSIKYKSPLQYAVTKDHREIVDRLLVLGADATYALPDGATALHYAAKFNRSQNALKLLLNGAAYNATTINGKTALDFCDGDNATAQLLRLVQLAFSLVENGVASPQEILSLVSEVRNSKGQTICSILRKTNNETLKNVK